MLPSEYISHSWQQICTSLKLVCQIDVIFISDPMEQPSSSSHQGEMTLRTSCAPACTLLISHTFSICHTFTFSICETFKSHPTTSIYLISTIQSPHLSFSILFLCTVISVILSNPIPATYLIFVIFFTLIHFESWKFYTRKVRKFTTNGALNLT